MYKSEYVLKCISCGREFSPAGNIYTCSQCGNRKGTLEVLYDFSRTESITDENEKGLWRFLPILPVKKEFVPRHLLVGNTPLYSQKKTADQIGVKEVYIKDDGRNPTASLKDRASIVALSKAIEKGFKDIYAASTGNAASSLSGICAGTGVSTHIFIPHTTPEAKKAQMNIYGSEIFEIQGSYDEAFEISLKTGEERGWYCRNSAINPYLLEGKKTVGLEIWEELGNRIPDLILISCGDGTIFSGIVKAFQDLQRMKKIRSLPVVIGVQAEGSDSIKRTFEKGEDFEPVDIKKPCTVADSISVGKPRDVIKACKYAKQSGSFFISVTDAEICSAIIELARNTGVFAEPAGATAYAGLLKLKKLNFLHPKMEIVVIVTGNGLKDIRTPMEFLKLKTSEN